MFKTNKALRKELEIMRSREETCQKIIRELKEDKEAKTKNAYCSSCAYGIKTTEEIIFYPLWKREKTTRTQYVCQLDAECKNYIREFERS